MRDAGAIGAGGSGAERPTRVRWMVCGLACATSWLLYLHRYSWGVIKKDVQDEFGFTKDQLGWLDSAFSFTYATCQVPGGLAGDLLGPALVLTLLIGGWSLLVGGLVFGRGFWSLFAIRMAFGVTQAGAYPNLSKVTKSWFPLSIRTTVQGVIASFSGRLGGACAPLIIGTVLMGWWGLSWRTTLILLGALGLAFAVAFRLLFRNTPAEHPWANEAEQELVGEERATAGQPRKIRFSRDWLAWFSYAALLAHLCTSAFADQLYVNWIPTFLQEDRGLSKEAMGIFASLPLLGGAVGGMVAGRLNDWLIGWLGGPRWARTLVGVSGKVISAGLVLFSLTMEDGRWMMVVIALAKFFTDWSQPTVWGAVTDVSGPAAGSIFGTVNMAGSLGGVLAGPILGWIIRGYGWTSLFLVIAGIYVVSGLFWFLIDTSRPLVRPAPADESA